MNRGKIVVAGAAAAGKTTLVYRISDDEFMCDLPTTINSSYQEKVLDYKNQKVSLFIWDTAGQEKYHSISLSCLTLKSFLKTPVLFAF